MRCALAFVAGFLSAAVLVVVVDELLNGRDSTEVVR
jgi:hypothetical protein